MNHIGANNNKYLVVKAKGGMGNRMLCAVTGIIYGQLTGRKTIIDWRDGAYSNDGSNTFAKFFSCSSVYPETILPEGATVRPQIWTNRLDKSMSNLIQTYDPNKHGSVLIHRKYSIDVRDLEYAEDILVFWYYKGRIRFLRKHLSNPEYGFDGLTRPQIIRKVLAEEMKVTDEVRQRLDDYKSANWPDKVIGVHVRHTDRKTNLAKYEKHLCRFIKRYPDAHIFLTTDNQQVNKEYRSRFKNVFSTSKWFPNGMLSMHQNMNCPDKIANGIEALVDMHLLAQCDCLIYSGYSTFSQISHILSDAPPENIIDIDRFNVKVRSKKLIRELVA